MNDDLRQDRTICTCATTPHTDRCNVVLNAGDDELDAARLAEIEARWTPQFFGSDDLSDEACRVMAARGYEDIPYLVTALATAKGEVERAETEALQWQVALEYERVLTANQLDALANAESALSTAEGERDAAVAAGQAFRAERESFHPDHWVAAKSDKYCDACDFCATLATLEAPHA